MKTDYSKHMYFRWKVKWRVEHLGALGTMGETVPLMLTLVLTVLNSLSSKGKTTR